MILTQKLADAMPCSCSTKKPHAVSVHWTIYRTTGIQYKRKLRDKKRSQLKSFFLTHTLTHSHTHAHKHTQYPLHVWLYNAVWLIMWSSDLSWVAARGSTAAVALCLPNHNTHTLLSVGPCGCVCMCMCVSRGVWVSKVDDSLIYHFVEMWHYNLYR